MGMLEFGNIDVTVSGNDSYIVKGNNKYVRLGEKELKYLFQVKGIETYEIVFSTDEELSSDGKKILDEKIEEWGFLDERLESKINTNKKFDLSMIRLVSINPDKLLDKVYPIGHYFFSKISVVIYVVMNILAGVLMVVKSNVILDGLQNLKLTFQAILIILVAMLFTLSLHELGHVIVCKKYGGTVSRTGVVLFFFMPCLYCDVSDIYLFKNQKEKIFVSISGLYVNSFLCTLSLLIYFVIGQKGLLLLYYASNLGFIVYNLIPFVKMDGYWFLSGCLNLSNMFTKSITMAFSSIFDVKLLKQSSVSIGKKTTLVIFGWLALFFRPIFWCFSIIQINDILNLIVPNIVGHIIMVLIIVLVVSDVIKFYIEYIKIFIKDRKQIVSFL